MPSLCEALTAGGIAYRVGGQDKESVLRSVVEAMPLPEEVDRELLLQVLLAREALGSTGIGDGIAIPHVRNPIVLHVLRPTITLCFLENPMDFGALDGKPVRCLFTMVSPTVRAHLHLLSKLAFVLRDPGFKAVLMRQGLREEILAELRRAEAALLPSEHKRPGSRWTMGLFLLAAAVLALGGCAALLAGRSRWASVDRRGQRRGRLPGGPCPCRPGPVGRAGRRAAPAVGHARGRFHVALDALSGFFLLPIAGRLRAGGGLRGSAYLRPYAGRKHLGVYWFFFNLLVASMVLVVVARNAVLFLVAWEVMSLASFFLVTFENEKAEAREAGWTYLVATHLGTAFLLVMFVLLAREAGTLDFAGIAHRSVPRPA